MVISGIRGWTRDQEPRSSEKGAKYGIWKSGRSSCADFACKFRDGNQRLRIHIARFLR